jgi:ribosomal protein S18 acetylase RimI-like enzyme
MFLGRFASAMPSQVRSFVTGDLRLATAKTANVDVTWTQDARALRIRDFERGELQQFLEIFVQAIPSAQLSRSIYLAPGVEAFLARLLEHPSLHSREQLWGVELKDTGFVAAAHTRLMGEYQHLNNYAVLPAFQGRGLGGRMMAHWESLARSQRARRLSLDVTLENEGARRHYARFGFSEEARTYEYRLQGSPKLNETTDVHLIDWAVAQACFGLYGFGRFALAVGSDQYSVDLRSGEFRLRSCDERLLAGLRSIDPARRILVWTDEPLDSPSWIYVGTIVRMTRGL